MANHANGFRLPEEMRAELAQPYGPVLECEEIANRLRDDESNVITIGDYVSSALIKRGISPSLIIWDGQTRRAPCHDVRIERLSSYAEPRVITNPAGIITREAYNAVIAAASSKGPISLKVTGEEDLLTIPAVIAAPEGSWIVYGHPPGNGAILILVNRKIKSVFEDIASRLESL